MVWVWRRIEELKVNAWIWDDSDGPQPVDKRTIEEMARPGRDIGERVKNG